ncbi:hypothetical protein ABGB14_37000 [Nonomuraea sp. B10E15]|uniref:hypothetical protein n=1 Tax=Nonomuraea sp. B10E15 TaxID=3153560 RepID=UPI00325D95C0
MSSDIQPFRIEVPRGVDDQQARRQDVGMVERGGFREPLFANDRPLLTDASQTACGLVADTVSNEAAQVRGPQRSAAQDNGRL